MNEFKHLKGKPYPKVHKALIGKKGENPYFPMEFLELIKTKKSRLVYVQQGWHEANLLQSKDFIIKRISK